jgi:hypothetical protein
MVKTREEVLEFDGRYCGSTDDSALNNCKK